MTSQGRKRMSQRGSQTKTKSQVRLLVLCVLCVLRGEILLLTSGSPCMAQPGVIQAGALEPINGDGTQRPEAGKTVPLTPGMLPPPEQLGITRRSPDAKEKSAPEGKSDASEAPAYPSVLPPPIQTCSIDLGTVLRLAESVNPTIGISRQQIQTALANQLQADVLLLPTLRAGGNYHSHQGILQTSFGLMREVDSSSLYAGGGARALAAETVAFPMVQLFSPLADAFLQPLIARRFVAVRSAQSGATTNNMLLEVANRFLELVAAEAEFGALRRSEEDMGQIVQLTASFARAREGREADARRAQSEALLLRVEVQRAEERVAVASSNLAELLNLDTSIRLKTPIQAIGLLQLVDPTCDLQSLVLQGQTLRPEIVAARAEIARRDAQVTQEKVRPFLPTLSIGVSTGTFGGGTNRTDLVPINPSFGRFSGRTDVDVIAYWTVQNMGVGNVALKHERQAERQEASLEMVRILNLIRREVTAAYIRTKAAMRRFQVAQQQLRTTEDGYKQDVRRIRGGQGLPIEIINSANRLIAARVNLVRSILEFNRAQFELFVAIGGTPGFGDPVKKD